MSSKKTISELKKIADSLFRKAIHARHPDVLRCPTCDELYHNCDLQVGHAFRRNETAARYCFFTATLQCEVCNYACADLKPFFIKTYPGWEAMVNEIRMIDIRRHHLEEIIKSLQNDPETDPAHTFRGG